MASKKLKLLFLAKMFQEQTDEDHQVTVKDMIAYLDSCGISAERKVIYEDIGLLRDYGMDIVQTVNRAHYYYLGQRDFELPELKMLIDVVQSSPFLTSKKSVGLIGKLERLASTFQAGSLRRQVYVLNRVKTLNEQLYYNIDGIHQAINENRCIEFRYFDWNLQGGLVYRHSGKIYREGPAALCVDRNYYLVTYRPGPEKFIHFRVDRISDLQVTDIPRPTLPEGFDPARYMRTIFDMHSGDTQRVTLELDKHLLNLAIDRFGRDAFYRPGPDGTFFVTADVEVSPTFLSWVLCFGGEARIVSPDSARHALRQLVREAMERYEDE